METTKSNKLKKLKKLLAENPFYIHYIQTTETLNNEYYVTKLAIQGLTNLRESLKEKEPFSLEIEVPTVNGKEIKKVKDKSRLVDILKKSIKTDLYANSIGSGVSTLEKFLEEIIRTVLTKHPGKLSVDVESKSKEEKKIDLKDVLAAKSLEDIYAKLIDQKLFKLFYSTPAEYFKYFKDTIQINLDEDLVLTYVEVKATRDLVVHNKGKVNALYIQKAGTKARTTDTQQNIPFSPEYYMQSFSTFKRIVKITYELASAEYLKVTDQSKLYVSK